MLSLGSRPKLRMCGTRRHAYIVTSPLEFLHSGAAAAASALGNDAFKATDLGAYMPGLGRNATLPLRLQSARS
jgi:hypothetical protein